VVNITVWMDHPPVDSESTLPIPLPENNDGELLPLVNGSGFVWDAEGHIVTNYHVVEGGATLPGDFLSTAPRRWRRSSAAMRTATWPCSRSTPEGYDLTPVQPGNMDEVYVGMRVAAIGNPFGCRAR
jgi:serine protease Do